MPLTVNCPSCASQLRVPDELLGRAVACPKCRANFTVNNESASSTPSPSVSHPMPPPLSPSPPPLPSHRMPAERIGPTWEEDEDDDDYRPRIRRRRGDGDLRPGVGFGVTAMVLGILSLVFSCLCGVFGVPLPVLAIIFGCLGLGREGRGMALAGLIMGIIALALSVLLFLFVGLAMFTMPTTKFR